MSAVTYGLYDLHPHARALVPGAGQLPTWIASATITIHENENSVLMVMTLGTVFETQSAALSHALQAAMKWADDNQAKTVKKTRTAKFPFSHRSIVGE
jgi:uncharacterized membrane-anchored protein